MAFLVVRFRVVVFFAGGVSPSTAGVEPDSDVASAAVVAPGSAVAAAFLVVRLRVVVFFAVGVSPPSVLVAAASAAVDGAALSVVGAAAFLVVRLRGAAFFFAGGASPPA